MEIEHGVPTGSLGRVFDGRTDRMDALRGLGNAVTPAQAEFIGRMIVEATKNRGSEVVL